MSHRLPIFTGFALVAALAGGGCSDSDTEVHAVDIPRPVLPVVPRKLAKKDEHAALAVLTKSIQEHGPVRTLVHLEGVVAEPASSARRPAGTTRTHVDPSTRKRGAKILTDAENQFLKKLGRENDESVVRFGSIPYVALTMGLEDVRKLAAWIDAVPLSGPARPFRIFVEEAKPLKKQSAASASSGLPIEDALARMEIQAEPMTMTAAPLVVVVDDRVDETLALLSPVVEAIEWMADDPVQEIPLRSAYPITGQTIHLSHGTQVACVLAKTAPAAKIIGLDVTSKSGGIYADSVLQALDRVVTRWSVARPDRITAVAMSLGDPTWATSSPCDATTETSIAFALLVAELDAIDVAVVVPSGNDGLFPNEVFFPGCVSTAVTVGGTEMPAGTVTTPTPLGSSNWGALLDCSALGTMVSFEVDPAVGRFDINGGTSIAVPFVAGSFAILRGAHPEHTSATILSALQATGAPVTGGGAIREIRVHAALQGLTSPPVATPDPTPEPQPTPTPTLPG